MQKAESRCQKQHTGASTKKLSVLTPEITETGQTYVRVATFISSKLGADRESILFCTSGSNQQKDKANGRNIYAKQNSWEI